MGGAGFAGYVSDKVIYARRFEPRVSGFARKLAPAGARRAAAIASASGPNKGQNRKISLFPVQLPLQN